MFMSAQEVHQPSWLWCVRLVCPMLQGCLYMQCCSLLAGGICFLEQSAS